MSGIDALKFAELDTDRKKRTGFPEVVFCQGKKGEFLQDIFAKLYAANGISVVNIDNGFGAGYIATQINSLAERGKTK